MAAVLKRLVSRGVTAVTTIGGYTVPAARTCAVKGLSIAARGGIKAAVKVELCDNTDTVLAAIVESAEVPGGDTLVVVGAEQTVFLQPNDRIRVTATAGSVDVILSLAEIS